MSKNTKNFVKVIHFVGKFVRRKTKSHDTICDSFEEARRLNDDYFYTVIISDNKFSGLT